MLDSERVEMVFVDGGSSLTFLEFALVPGLEEGGAQSSRALGSCLGNARSLLVQHSMVRLDLELVQVCSRRTQLRLHRPGRLF